MTLQTLKEMISWKTCPRKGQTNMLPMNINELCVPKSFNNLLQRLVSCAARDAEIAMTVEQSAVEMVRAAVQTLPHSQGERFGGVHKDMP